MNTDVVPTRYWHYLDDGQIQCDLCPRHCHLQEGQRGLCYVRQRLDDQVKLVSYGRSSGFCIDPIEKKPLNHFYPGSAVLSFGTAGCNLACKFCQNWDMTKSREMDTLADAASPEQLAIAAHDNDCASIAFTYNDPVIFMEYALDVAAACRDKGVHTVAVTAGYIDPQPRVEFFRGVDAANVDLKAFDDNFYYKLCGAHLQPILETLQYIRHETDTWLELTTLLIPGENDSDAELQAMTQWVVEHLGPDVPMHFTAFHPDWKMREHSVTPRATLTRARKIAMGNGVRYAYTGNVRDAEGGSTWCPTCGALLIERLGYQLGRWGIGPDGCCQRCQSPVPGCVADGPGSAPGHPVRVRMVH
jgi:pyruvate formate lyase activating enzyme